MIDVSKLVRNNIAQLAPYSTARDEYKGELGIYLDANENPFNNGVNRYPDPHCKALKERIAELKNINIANLFLGNGSDEAIDLIFRVFCTPTTDTALAITPSYGMYKVAAATNDVKLTEVALKADYSLDKDAITAAITPRTKLLFICSPNNPTANTLSKSDIIDIASQNNIMLVIDEAYIDFSSDEGFSKLIDSYPNIIVLQTLSKAWGMAGLRIGMAIASDYVIGLMNKVKYPYNISVAAQEKALSMLTDYHVARYSKQVSEIIAERDKMIEELKKISLIETVYPSDANFILVKVADAQYVYNSLISSKIIVRNRSTQTLCSNTLRITVGTALENEWLIKKLKFINSQTLNS